RKRDHASPDRVSSSTISRSERHAVCGTQTVRPQESLEGDKFAYRDSCASRPERTYAICIKQYLSRYKFDTLCQPSRPYNNGILCKAGQVWPRANYPSALSRTRPSLGACLNHHCFTVLKCDGQVSIPQRQRVMAEHFCAPTVERRHAIVIPGGKPFEILAARD